VLQSARRTEQPIRPEASAARGHEAWQPREAVVAAAKCYLAASRGRSLILPGTALVPKYV
jgi:hypothetical protein